MDTKFVKSSYVYMRKVIAHIESLYDILKSESMANISLTWDANVLAKNGKKNGMEKLCALLYTQSFNNKDGWKIAATFDEFYYALPSHNGECIWSVKIPDDATILLNYTEYILDGKESIINRESLNQLIHRYGKEVNADEISLDCEDVVGFCPIKNWEIRFWWD